MGNVHVVGPNEALGVSGGCCGSTNRLLVVGGWTWVWWQIADAQKLSLEVMTVRPMCENVATANRGICVTVTGVANCRVITKPELLAAASENFLGRDILHIKAVILESLDEHLSDVVGKRYRSLTVDEIYQDRNHLAALVRARAAPEIGQRGIEILCFTIKDIVDEDGHLTSLGKAQSDVLISGVSAAMTNQIAAAIRDSEYENASLAWKEGYRKVPLQKQSSSTLLRH